MKRKPLRLRAKIFIYLLAFCSVLLALLWLFQVVFLGSVYTQIKVGEVKAAMGAISASVSEGNDESALLSLADSIANSRGINVTIHSSNARTLFYTSEKYDAQGYIDLMRETARLYLLTLDHGGEYFEYPQQANRSAHATPGGQSAQSGRAKSDENAETRPNVSSPSRNTGGKSSATAGLISMFLEPQAQKTINQCRLIDLPSGDGALVILSAIVSPVDATVGTLKVELYAVSAVMLIFATALALLIARHVSRPIDSINASAKTLASGRYDAHFIGGGYREVDELADTLNIAAHELSAVDGLRRELVANVTHDLRTPLTLIAGYAEAMRDLPGENTPENAQVIVDEANRLNHLVGDVLDLSKLESGALEMTPAPYNLTQSLRAAVERLAELTKAGGYHISFEVFARGADGVDVPYCSGGATSNDAVIVNDGATGNDAAIANYGATGSDAAIDNDCATSNDAVIVNADERLISQAFYNLLTNAVNFTGEDKRVAVRQTVSNGSVTVAVADTGKGIAPEELPRIWDRYFRTGVKHRRAVVGTGIGLSIVKSVMDMHGGTYGVESTLGSGSVFWIQLKI